MHSDRMPRSARRRMIACLSLILALSAMLAGCATAIAAGPGPVIDKEMDAFLQAHLATGQFMGAVLVARGDEVLHRAGYGMANLELDVPMTPESVLRIASVTKQFTAAAILQLQDQGLLDVHDPVSRYLPDYPHGDEITLHQLLNHSSGTPDFETLLESGPGFRQAISLEAMMATFSDLPLDFPPGSQYSYSNSGYVVLTAILEKLTSQRYADYMAERFFVPLGMTATGYDDPLLSSQTGPPATPGTVLPTTTPNSWTCRSRPAPAACTQPCSICTAGTGRSTPVGCSALNRSRPTSRPR